jgi:hypothetical protein
MLISRDGDGLAVSAEKTTAAGALGLSSSRFLPGVSRHPFNNEGIQMAEQMTVKIRSKNGSPIRLDALAKQVEQAGCEIVAVPTIGTHVRVKRPPQGWPPLKSISGGKRLSAAPDFGPEIA